MFRISSRENWLRYSVRAAYDGFADVFRVFLIGTIVTSFMVLCSVRVTNVLTEMSQNRSDIRRDLKAVFLSEKSEFQKLISLLQEDAQLGRVTDSYLWLANENDFATTDALDSYRWDQYRELFVKLGLKEGAFKDGLFPGMTFLIADREGSLSGRSERGYVYCESEAIEFCESLAIDPSVSSTKPFLPLLASLGEGWFVYDRDWN